MDLINDWDFEREDSKRVAWKRVREEAPYVLIGFPLLHVFHRLSGAQKGGARERAGVDREVRQVNPESDQACRVLLRIVQVPDSARQALLARASLDGQILEVSVLTSC